MTISFIIPQNAKLNFVYAEADSPACYSKPFNGDFEGLARGQYPEIQRFTRIQVNGVLPLAAWLLDIGTEMWANVKASQQGEVAYPVQMAYGFTVQVTTGLDVRYSLVNPVWNPLAPAGTISSQQMSKLQFTLNGGDAGLFFGANTGTAVIGSAAGQPPYAPIPGVNAPSSGSLSHLLTPKAAQVQTVTPKAGTTPSVRRGVPQGFLQYPLPLLPSR
jgi:hypothetical protein